MTLEKVIPPVMIAVACAAAALVPGRLSTRGACAAGWALAALVLGSELAWLAFAAASRLPLAAAVPLQLCDAATFLAAAALVTRRPLLVEVTYFWGLAGTTQALLAPDLNGHFPSFLYWQYYAGHGAVVVAAFFLVGGLRLWPRPGAVWRALGVTAVFAAVAGGADLLFGTDYMFLRLRPPTPSPLDLMGPWPWYIATGAVVCVILFVFLDAPFWPSRRAAGSASAISART